jgi:hypothetical protein
MLAIGLATLAATPALAGPPVPDGPSGEPDNDIFLGARTPAQAAFEATKLQLVAAIEASSPIVYAASGSTKTVALSMDTDPDAVDYSGIGGGTSGSQLGSGSGSSGGTTGYVPARDHVVLNVRARHQSEIFWCGPASAQVVINYSRGYVYDSLNGDSHATNWKTQATLAAWMNTTEAQGTRGSRLAATLNRPDAVLKPIPEWSYVYGTNQDANDLHSKVVADVAQFAMPLVIAVKPHKTDGAYWLPSWPREAGNAKHWIVIYGFDRLFDGSASALEYYTESAGNGSKNPGQYVTDAITMWKVNQYNASTIVW